LLIRALFGEWGYKVHAGELAPALLVAQEMVSLAALENDPIVRIVAATSLGISYTYAGRLIEGRNLFEQCLADPNISAAQDLGSPHPQDHEVLARTYLSRVLACLGENSRAAREADLAIERARTLKHQPSVAMALTMGCRLAWLMRDEQLVQQRAAELIALSREQGFAYWLARGRCYAGWVAIAQGKVKSGLALLQEALSHLKTTDVAMGNIAGIVGDAYARAGDLTTALHYVDTAFQVSSATGEVWMDAELHRLRGAILAAPPTSNAQAAESHFLHAIDIAKEQSARLWELRASLALTRLWHQQGKSSEALELLRSALASFPDGARLSELTEAQILVSELHAVVGGAPVHPAPQASRPGAG
jgi:predicted ATPase